MITAANPTRRLAPRTSSRKCALSSQNSFSNTSNGIRKTPDPRSRFHPPIDFHYQQRKINSQNNSPKHEIIFNIHNPNQHHRDRNACAFLLTS
jgi:hypothetical protein